MKNKILKQIPNVLTLGNLTCGLVAMLLLIHNSPGAPNFLWIGIAVGAAMIFDFFDGFAARLLKTQSDFGKELDSLADLVTFGILPGMLLIFMMTNNGFYMLSGPQDIKVMTNETVLESPWWIYLLYAAALMIPIFSAVRLAKFNVDERPGNVFYGLATPANALFILSLFLIFALDSGMYWTYGFKEVEGALFHDWANQFEAMDQTMRLLSYYAFNPFSLAILSVIFSLLLISEYPLIAFKFKSYGFKENKVKYIFLTVSLILVVILFYKAVPLIIVLYFLFSWLDHRTKQDEVSS